ncbi:MAG: deoxynucleoside kinase [Saprospiraceae bacterium]
MFPYSYIAIEGNIGTGKTTLCNMLAEESGCRLVLEEFADNPFLENFYKNPERFAFTVELFFMTERHKQLQANLTQRSLFQEMVVADYFFLKTLLFAKNNLTAEEYRLFQRLFDVLNSTFPHPDILVYLHRSPENLLANIKQRGRTCEQEITVDYLQQIQNAYFEYFKGITDLPVVIIDVEGMEFWNKREEYDLIKYCLQKKYPPGVHRVNLR